MSTPEDDLLESLLKTSEPYLDDAGFTQRVLQALPPRRDSVARTRILWGFGLAAAAVVALGPGSMLAEPLLNGAFAWSAFGAAVLSFAVLAATAVSVALREAES